MKICRPLIAITGRLTAFAQCVSLTMRGCRRLDAAIPGVPLVFPESFFATKDVGDAQRVDMFARLVAKLHWQVQPERSTVAGAERPSVHLVARKRLRVQTARHVER